MKIVYPASGKFGVKVLNLKLTTVKPSEIAELKQLINKYKLVILPEQNINKFQYMQFASSLGVAGIYPENSYYLDYPEFFNYEPNICDRGKYWYSDRAFLQEPLPFTMVLINNLPRANRAIYYIDMEQVYRKIPRHLKKYLDDKQCFHELKYGNNDHLAPQNISQSILNPSSQRSTASFVARHPLVTVHPVTGAEILYLSSGLTTRIEGMNAEVSQEILQELFAFSAKDEHIQPYILQDGDILLWENRTLNYMSSHSKDFQRCVKYQIGISDGLPFYYSSIKQAIQQAQKGQLSLN